MKIFLSVLALFLFSSQELPAVEGGGIEPEKEMEQITKELGDFKGQAEEVIKQLEKVAPGANPGAATQPGAPATPLDIARQKAMRLANDERFLKNATDLLAHPARKKMLYIQIGFFIFMLLLKAWGQSKVQNWFKRMLLGFVLTILMCFGLSYVIPVFVLGEPFVVVTTTIFRVFVFGGP